MDRYPLEPHSWVHQHDNRWSFILPYTGLAVVLSAFVSLFWLVFLILIHFGIEWMRFRSFRQVLPQMHLDLALLIAAVAVEVYLGVLLGAAGVGQAARGGAKVMARFPIWHRMLRVVLIGADDLINLLRLSKNPNADGKSWMPKIIVAISIAMLLMSPILLERATGDVFDLVISAFHPLPK